MNGLVRPLWPVVALCLAACAGRPVVERDALPPEVPAQERAQFEKAVAAFDANEAGNARGRFEKLIASAPDSVLVPHARVYLGRLTAEQDAGKGADALLALGRLLPEGEPRTAARFYGGIAAAQARRCLTAHKVLPEFLDDARRAAEAAQAMVGCARGLDPLVALAALDRAAKAAPESAEALATSAEAPAAQLDLAGAKQAVDRFGAGALRMPVRHRLAELARAAGDQALARQALAGLDEGAAVPMVAPAAKRIRIGVVLPLSGRSRPLGQRLEATVNALRRTAEDGLGEAPELILRDGGEAASAQAAIADLVETEHVFGIIGAFDGTTAKAAAEAAAERGVPLLMLTVSDAAVRVDGPIWRLLYTPVLVARTAAGAAMARGGKVAAVLRPETPYGEVHARWFADAWRAGGGQVAGELTWPANKPDWKAITARLAHAPFDTLFVPGDPVAASLALRHLAAAGVWAKGSKGRFGNEKGVREVIVIGTPEWYSDDLPRLGGRYVQGAFVPVPFAVETARGAALARRLGGPTPTAFDALLVDGVAALVQAGGRAASEGVDAVTALRGLKTEGGATPGFDLSARDALPTLFLLEVDDGRFTPAR